MFGTFLWNIAPTEDIFKTKEQAEDRAFINTSNAFDAE